MGECAVHPFLHHGRLSLAPRSRLASRYIDHFDFSAVASLTRNLVECYLAFFYLCVEVVDEDEWLTRLNLLQLHDCVSRLKMFRDFDASDPQPPGFQNQADELRAKLLGRAHFASLKPKQQKRFLSGDYAWLVQQDDLLTRLGVEVGQFRGFYRFLSSHVHSFPLAFYRMAERDQGRGVESDWEKGYIATALEFATDTVERGTQDMHRIFPDIPPAAK